MSDTLSALQNHVQSVLNSQFGTEEFQKLLESLNEAFQERSGDEQFLKEVCKSMLEYNILDEIDSLWRKLLKGNSILKLHGEHRSKNGALLLSMKVMLWNYTDKCSSLCKACFSDCKIISLLMEELRFYQSQLDELDDDYIRHHVKANFGILHNLVRHCDDNKSHIQDGDGLNVIAAFTKSDYLAVRTYAFVILAFCAKEGEESTLISAGCDEVIEFLKKLLHETLECANHVSERYGLSTAEVVQCLAKLAKIDKNKKKMADGGIFGSISGLLDPQQYSYAEIRACVEFMWTMSMREYSRKALLKHGILSKLEEVQKDAQLPPKISVEIRNVLHRFRSHKEGAKQKHVMLSYQWDSQELILQLRKYLGKKGINVWIDKERMKGSLNSCMAEAVENASIIVMGITKKYQESGSCQKEAEYADKLRVTMLPVMLESGYKASGWLGLLLGQKLYVDLTSEENLQQKFEEVVEQITELQR